jgi:hypothetical protein
MNSLNRWKNQLHREYVLFQHILRERIFEVSKDKSQALQCPISINKKSLNRLLTKKY